MLPSAWILYTARNRQTSDVFKTNRVDNRCICVCMCEYECKKVLKLRTFRNVQRLGKGESVLVESHDSDTRMRNQYVVTNRKPEFMTRTIIWSFIWLSYFESRRMFKTFDNHVVHRNRTSNVLGRPMLKCTKRSLPNLQEGSWRSETSDVRRVQGVYYTYRNRHHEK